MTSEKLSFTSYLNILLSPEREGDFWSPAILNLWLTIEVYLELKLVSDREYLAYINSALSQWASVDMEIPWQ